MIDKWFEKSSNSAKIIKEFRWEIMLFLAFFYDFFENWENVFDDLEAAIAAMIFVDGALESTGSLLSKNRVFSLIRPF